EDSKIYYTINGGDPDASSTLYTGAITISSSCVLKAVAIKEGSPASDIMTETYTITPGRRQEWSYTGYTLSRANEGTVVKVQGDSEINTKSGQNTNWEIEVSLQPRGNNAVASFTYTVKEQKGDYSILRLTQEVTIPLNRNDIQIVYPYNNYYLSGTITGEQHNYVTIYPENPVGGPIYNLSVRVDGSGNDEGNIGAVVYLGFNYTYQP
ncbi:MAG: chitobiase/beta-hexosaminidase C-terminal domain-containing protein, partial [Treponema sp.]|nr:chitobiase/beta-hexosaminidase C-terminal domain-containing protein [Treponema sp.]